MSNGGFTLVELLVSAGLSLFVLGVVYSVYRVQTRTVKSQESRLVATEDARAALDFMVREIRNAGYNPDEVTNGTNCAGTPNPGTPGVFNASSTTFGFTYDFQGAGTTPDSADGNCDDPNEEITYAFVTAGCPAGLGDIMRTANGSAQALTNCNVTNFQLAYFPQQTGAAPPAAICDPAGCTAAERNTIQKVTVTLTIRSTSPDNEFGGGQLNATMMSDASLRNRGLPPPTP